MTLHRYAKNYMSRFEKKLFSPYKGLSGMVMPLFLQIVSNPALFAVLVQRDVFSKKNQHKVSKNF